MQPSVHLLDNGADRALGQRWEREFCQLAASFDKSFTPMQIGRSGAASWHRPDGRAISHFLLPDVTIWTAPGEHHEIKHKNPTADGYYGLEQYRFESLLAFQEVTGQPVYYSIHDWSLAGATSSRTEMPVRAWDWVTIEVRALAARLPTPVPMPTYYGGKATTLPGYYWPSAWWGSLAALWIW